MNFIKCILFFLVFGVNLTVTGKNSQKSDSLLFIVISADSDSDKFAAIEKISNNINSMERDSTLAYWDLLMEHCAKNNFHKGLGVCYYYKASELKSALEYYQSYKAYEESKKYFEIIDYKRGIAWVLNGLGILYKELANYDQSFEHYIKGAGIYKEIQDTLEEGLMYLNIGDLFVEQDSTQIAIKYLGMSKNILEAKNDVNLNACYINIGLAYDIAGKYDSSFYYFSKSYELSQKSNDIPKRFDGYYYLGKFFYERGRLEEAEPLLQQAEEIANNQKNKNVLTFFDLERFTILMSEYYAAKKDFTHAYSYLLESVNYEIENKKAETNLKFQSNLITLEKEENEKNVKRIKTIIIASVLGFIISFLLIFILYRNYHHKQRANKLLTEMDELKTRLYSNITHELRTPLTLILGPLEQMLSSEAEKAPTRKQVKMMRKNANSLLGLVNQMLDLSKIDAKNMKLELVENDINKFLRTRFTAFATLAEQKSIDYQFSLLKEKNIRVFDEVKLEKIINNLISNAIKFTKKQGEIRCFANFPKPDVLEFIVQDSGKGIPKNEQDKIFDRFHQIKSDDAINTTGTGIGLSLTKELVELMHGKIKVESEEERGTRFTVTIPLGTEHLNKDEYQLIQNLSKKKQSIKLTDVEDTDEECEIENGIVETVDTTTLQVLIVDDHRDIREFIAENLKDCFTVETAANGESAYNKATKKIPDLVITDLVMPKMDGIELCRTLKTDEKTSHIPIIMLTGKSSIEDRIEGIETGADAYLTKPFNIKELRLRAQKLIEQRQKLRERFTRDLKLEPKDIAVTSADEKFLNRVMEIIEKNIGNSEFEVRQFQEEMYMSRMQLFRKIKALTNQTPGEFIRTIRLKRAASLMKQNFGNIAQITFEVGFNNPSYFAKCFKELYGKLPSEYMKEVT